MIANLDRPEPFRAPDPVEWEKKHGQKVTSLPSDTLAEHIEAARDLVQLDRSTILADEVHEIHANMDGLCTSVALEMGCEEDGIVFFDPVEGAFKYYPVAAKP